MNLKMKTLAAAMIAAGTLGTAQASSVLFPYVVNSSTVTTIVSVIDTNGYDKDSSTSEALHWVLWYKDGANAEKNDAACLEVNQYLPTSSNDIQTVDLGGKFGSTTKGVLFNDPSINNNWKASNKRFDMANLATKPLRGYLVIDDELPLSSTAQSTLEGEGMVFEFASGATWGYTAGRAADKDFTLDNDITFTSGQNINIKPWGEFTTKFFVTPIDHNMFDGNNAADSKKLTTIFMDYNGVVMYDRDENPVSGSQPQGVNCVGSINADALITASAKTLLPDAGWGKLNSIVGQDSMVKDKITAVSVIKLDYNSKATFNGEAVTGTFNNAFQLR